MPSRTPGDDRITENLSGPVRVLPDMRHRRGPMGGRNVGIADLATNCVCREKTPK